MNQSHLPHKTNDLRPGVSGILRCRNHGAYLRFCLDSCIEALDELIAIYHDSTDDTEEIIREYENRYPGKIKIIHHKEYVFPLNMDATIYEYAVRLPDHSPNLFCGYTNRAMAAASYKWIFRIDADQIYFPDQLKRICESYRSNVIPNDNVVAYYSGINLFLIREKWHVCLGGERGLYPLFNGYGDHFFHPNNEACYYTKFSGDPFQDKKRLTEYVPIRRPLVSGGFLWFHIPNLFPDAQRQVENQYVHYPNRFIGLDKLRNMTYVDFEKAYHPHIPFDFAKDVYRKSFDLEKHHMPWENLSSIKHRYNKIISTKRVRMSNSYHTEYSELLKHAIEDYLSKHKNAMVFDKADMSEAVKTLLINHLSEEEAHYEACRNNGKSSKEAMERVNRCIALFTEFTDSLDADVVSESRGHAVWNELLGDYAGATVAFADNSSTLQEHASQFNEVEGIKMLLSLDEMSDSAEFPDDCIAVKIENTNVMKDSNPFLRKNYPYIYGVANSMCWLLSILKPQAILIFSPQTVAGVVLKKLAVTSDIKIYDR